MNRLEQQMRDAAPKVLPATFPIDTKTELSPSRLDVQTLGPGTLPARRRSLRRLAYAGLVFMMLAGGGSWGLATITAAPVGSQGKGAEANAPLTSGESEATKSPSSLPAAEESATWRTATMVTPWADKSTSVEARIELPTAWRVQRHEASAQYPGLNVTILDDNSAPVAMLYFGPATSKEPCPLRAAPGLELQRTDVTTGAELLDPALAASFSFGVSTGAEPRAFFRLVSTSFSEHACKMHARNTEASSRLILRFGDVLGLDAATHPASAPKSSYARTFSSVEEAWRYLHSQEFSTLKRLVTSLKFSFPEDRSELWRVPDPRPSWPRD